MANVEKALARIRATVEEGAYYEAQQQYKSTYHRHKARKQVQESLQVLQAGAITQLSHGQITCGVELGLLLVEAYTADGTPADDASLGRLLTILEALPVANRPGSSGQDDEATTAAIDESGRLVAAAVKWAHKAGSSEAARQINDSFARHLWMVYGNKRIGRALIHFTRGSDARMFAEALHSCALQGPHVEVDLWLLRAVVQVVGAASKHSKGLQLRYARELYEQFMALSPALDTPAIHLADLLLLSLENSSHELYGIARDKYSVVLRRDTSFAGLLSRVEQVYFNIAPAGAGLEGLLGGLLKSLGEMDDME